MVRITATARQLQDVTGYTPKWWEARRAEKNGPPYIRLPNGRVVYPWDSFQQWYSEYLATGERHER